MQLQLMNSFLNLIVAHNSEERNRIGIAESLTVTCQPRGRRSFNNPFERQLWEENNYASNGEGVAEKQGE